MLPLALGLLALGGLGQSAVWSMKDAREARQREGFAADALKMQEGLDMNTPQGIQQFALRQMTDPRMIQYGNQMLGQSLERAQQNDQWKWGNENLTKAQQENLGIQRDRMAQEASEAQQRISQGWAGIDIQKAAAQRAIEQQMYDRQYMTPYQQAQVGLQQQELDQRASASPWKPEDLMKRETEIRDKYRAAMQPTQNITDSFQKAMSTLDTDNPIASQASIVNFVKTLDPGSVVRTEEGEQIAAAGGLSGQLASQLQGLRGKGKLTSEQKTQMRETLVSMQQQAEQRARVVQEYWKTQGQADPALGLPAVNERVFGGYDLDVSKRYRQAQAIPGTDGNMVVIPGLGVGRKVN